MKTTIQKTGRVRSRRRRLRRNGFTLIETVIAAGISTIVLAAMLGVFVWTIRKASDGRQFGWAQTEAAGAAQKVIHYVRKGVSVDSIAANGNWVQVTMPGGTVSRVEYQNDPTGQSLGKRVFVPDITDPAGGTNIVAQGFSKVTTPPSRNVFELMGDSPNMLRIAFCVTEPLSPGECPVEIDTGVRLRNY